MSPAVAPRNEAKRRSMQWYMIVPETPGCAGVSSRRI